MNKIFDKNYNFVTTKFSMLDKNGHHGKVAAWIKKNPDFTAKELMNSGLCNAPIPENYYEEFITYRKFFSILYETK